jgi:hypothetical protein
MRSSLFVIALLLVFLISGALSMAFNGRTRPMPAACAALGVVLCLVLTARRDATTKPQSGSRVWRFLAMPFLVAAAGAAGGILAAAPAAYLGYALVSETRNWRSALTAAVISTLLAYVLFGMLLGVPVLP